MYTECLQIGALPVEFHNLDEQQGELDRDPDSIWRETY